MDVIQRLEDEVQEGGHGARTVLARMTDSSQASITAWLSRKHSPNSVKEKRLELAFLELDLERAERVAINSSVRNGDLPTNEHDLQFAIADTERRISLMDLRIEQYLSGDLPAEAARRAISSVAGCGLDDYQAQERHVTNLRPALVAWLNFLAATLNNLTGYEDEGRARA